MSLTYIDTRTYMIDYELRMICFFRGNKILSIFIGTTNTIPNTGLDE